MYVDTDVLRRAANNVRSAYFNHDCIEAQYIELAADELDNLRKEFNLAMRLCRGKCGACKNYTYNHCEGKCANCEYDSANFGKKDLADQWEWVGL